MGKKNDRNFFRVDAFMPVSARLVPEEEREFLECDLIPDPDAYEAMMKMKQRKVNISGAGMYFESDKAFGLGEVIEITAALKDIYEGIVVLYGRVIRCDYEGRYFGVAVDFLNISQLIINLITNFVLQRERELIAEKKIGWL